MAIEPVTREERFLAAAGGRSVTPPAPITRKEQLLQGIIDAVKSGGATPDVIEGAVNDYLDENPVKPGATTEQAAQIERNKTDIADLQTEVDELKESGGNGSGQNHNYTLPVATPSVLGGVKPTAKTEGMTQPVAVDEDGGLWTVAGASGTVLVAASDAPDIIKAAAQYVCTGINDQMAINAAIQAVGKGEVRMYGGNYNITAEITLIDDITLSGRNAIINVCDEISSTITQAYTGGDTVIHVADASVFVVGQKVSPADSPATESKFENYIVEIDTDANTVTLDKSLSIASWDANVARLVADFAAVSCKYRKNVIIDGLIVNSNGATYKRYDTVFGCNGIELYSSTNCKIINCTVREARTHGIAIFLSDNCVVQNSFVKDCYELGIDMANGASGEGGHVVIGCMLEQTGRALQMHYGKRISVIGCVFKGCGAGTQGSAHDVIITGCNFIGSGSGIYCNVSPGKDVIISNNIIADTEEAIQIDAVTDVSITGNIIRNCTSYGIKVLKTEHFVIANNKLIDVGTNDTKTEISTNAAIVMTNACSYGLVTGNNIRLTTTETKGCACGIAENNMLGDYNVVTGNIIRGARIQATRKLGANSKFENNYEFV